MSAFDYKNVARVINRFRYYLAIVDGLNVLALWFILTRLHVKNSPLWAGVIGLLPTSWIGSSVWGQIDGMGQFLILLFFALFIGFNAKPRPTWQAYLYFPLGAFLLALMLLTKQLVYFSMGALGLILLVSIIRLSRSFQSFMMFALPAAAGFLFPIFFVDAALQLKPPYVSHLQYILATGSQHGDTISSLGFNIWVFFTNDLLGSSRLPLQIGSFSLALISPYFAGLTLFVFLNIVLFILFLRDLRRQDNAGMQTFNIGQVISTLFYFSLVNLTFNLTLTGTHERYLYHFYPFILMACLGLLGRSHFINRPLLISLFAGALFYGVYLFLCLSGVTRPTDQLIIQAAAVVHLSLYIYLLYSWIRNSTSQFSDLTPA